jgi:hypothetical protein
MTPHTLAASAPVVVLAAGASGTLHARPVAPTLVAWAPPGAGERSPGWQADAGGGGISGGGLLLLAAYAAIWLVAFGLIALALLRQNRMNVRIDHLTGELAAAGERASKARKAAAKAKKVADVADRRAKAVSAEAAAPGAGADDD